MLPCLAQPASQLIPPHLLSHHCEMLPTAIYKLWTAHLVQLANAVRVLAGFPGARHIPAHVGTALLQQTIRPHGTGVLLVRPNGPLTY